MKRIVVAILLVSGLSARADEAAHTKLAEEALAAMNVQNTIEQSFEAARKMQMAQMANMKLTATETASATAMQDEIMALIQKEFSWDKVKADYIKLYSELFTEADLKGLIEFYQSPVGRKFVEKMPEMMQKSAALSQKQMMGLMPKIQAITRPRLPTPAPAPLSPAK